MCGFYWSGSLFQLLGQEPELANIAQEYFRGFMIGFPAIMYFAVDRQFSMAHESYSQWLYPYYLPFL